MPKKSGDIVVTKKMLDETRDELKSETATLRLELGQTKEDLTDKIDSVRSELTDKIESVRSELTAKIDSVKSELKSEITSLRIEIQKQNSISHRCLALYEEQNARNKYVLDGYDQIYRRQEEYEKRLKAVEA